MNEEDNIEPEVKEVIKEINTDYKDMYIRVLAEFENYRKKLYSSVSEARLDGKVEAAEAILPALDNFDQAMSMITDKNTLIGLEYIKKNLMSAIESIGISRISTDGEFDPNKHNAVGNDTDADIPDNHIVKELSAGYIIADRVIKFAQVIVKKENKKDE